MYRISLVIVSLFLVAAPRAATAQSQLSSAPDSILDAPPFDRSFWGVLVTGPDEEIIFERNADRLFIPASSTKLVVSAMGAIFLDPEFRISTEVYGTGPLEGGVLDGDLLILGHGDPTFGERCYGPDVTAPSACETMWSSMDMLADQVLAAGVRHVTGAIVGDGSYFEATIVHPGWESYDLNWWYAAPVSGLAFNDNSLNVTWGPGELNAPATISWEPNLGDFSFDNRTRTVDSSGDTNIDFFRVPGTQRIWAEGTVVEHRRDKTEYFAVFDPNRFFATALRSRLELKGIRIDGATEATTEPRDIGNLNFLATHESRRLEDLIYPILSSSQNLFAESLLKNLAANLGEAGSWDEGIALETSFLIDTVGIDSTAFELHDGSGLASSNVITPRAFVRLLDFMENHPNNAPFMRGLPRSGGRGSLARRFLETPLEGLVTAKTGAIYHVNSLNGYVDTRGGRVKFSVMVNSHTAGSSAATRRIDEFLVALLR